MKGAPERPITHVLACKRIKVAKVRSLLPDKYVTSLEQNQLLKLCCRHADEHEIEGWRSHPDEKAPDIYILHCRCGRKHIRFCVGGGDIRPVWEIG